MLKRTLDILLALLAIILASPAMILTAILVRIDSPGPIIFRQRRIGRNGKEFTIYKFRTMVEGADSLGPSITAQKDPRITQIGQILRNLKIDELPQFFNVLKGDMSFVGPRPEVPEMAARYSLEQKKALAVRPGILGPSQISRLDESSKMPASEAIEQFYAEKILPEKLKTDLEYIEDPDPWKDLKILFRGSKALLFNFIKLRYILESRRRFFFLLFDLGIIVSCFWIAYGLRFEGKIPSEEIPLLLTLLPFVVVIKASCFIYFGLYQSLWQYLGIQELIAIIKAVTVSGLLLPVVSFLLEVKFLPRSILIIDWMLLITALGGSRVIFKLTAERLRKPRLGQRKNVLIVGAGDTGELLVREFIKRPNLGCRPVGFLDRDPQKLGLRIHGIKVMGKIAQLPHLVKIKKIDEVIIALPESSGSEIKKIMGFCRVLNLPCRIVPHASPLLSPHALPLKLRPIDVSDLLGRELVQADLAGIQSFFREKRVLITGAGGSIGSELARIISQTQPKELILVDYSENNLYDIETDLNGKPSGTVIHSYLRDITAREEMEKIFEKHKPQVIYHAAAYKHVPLVELHFANGITNNVLGTKILADLAQRFQAERFVLISTDKAIHPQSIMGATKRIAELYLKSLQRSRTQFLAVRFGNVFNSKGSVVPLFKKQIEQGGPITLTHPDVSRYFMDVSEAVFLILQATILGSSSEIFLLDMGEPVKIAGLAEDLIQLSGLSKEDIPIQYIGLRPGEKLTEELRLDSEEAVPTAHKKIKVWKSAHAPPAEVGKEIDELMKLVSGGAARGAVIEKLRRIVPEYRPWKEPR